MRTVLGRIDKKRNVGNSLEEHNISRLIFWSDHFCGVEFYRNRWGRSFNYRKTKGGCYDERCLGKTINDLS